MYRQLPATGVHPRDAVLIFVELVYLEPPQLMIRIENTFSSGLEAARELQPMSALTTDANT